MCVSQQGISAQEETFLHSAQKHNSSSPVVLYRGHASQEGVNKLPARPYSHYWENCLTGKCSIHLPV